MPCLAAVRHRCHPRCLIQHRSKVLRPPGAHAGLQVGGVTDGRAHKHAKAAEDAAALVDNRRQVWVSQ